MIPGVEKSQVTFSFIHAYLAILIKHARLAVLLTALSATLTLFYYIYSRPIYSCKALIQVKLLSKPSDDNVDYTDESMYHTLAKQLQSDHILERAAHKLGLQGRHSSIRRRYCKTVVAKYNSESNLELQVFTYNRQLAEMWPAATYRAFEEYRQESRLQRRQRQIDSWLFDRRQIEAKIFEIEGEEKKLMERMKRWELQMDMAELRKVPEEIVAMRETIKMFTEIKEEFTNKKLDRDSMLSLLQRAQKGAKVEIGDIVPGVNNNKSKTEVYPQEGSHVILVPEMVQTSEEGWERLTRQLNDLQDELNVRLKVYREAHPEIKQLRAKIAEVEKRLTQDIKSMQNRFYAELERLGEREIELKAKLERYKVLSVKSEEFHRELNRLAENRKPWVINLSRVTNALNSYDVNEDRELFTLSWPQILNAPDNPVTPDYKKAAILMLALSVVLALGIPFLLEYLDNTFSVTEDAERQLKMKGLGIVPRVAVPTDGQAPREGKAPRIVQETFRMIRTNLITKSDFGDKRQVVMVTSSLPKEGKSMFSFNLAESFANLGERTLLIDLDLRRGHLNRCFNQAREPGITEYLLDTENGAANCCRETHNEMLHFVSGGKRVDNVTELLATSTFADFMARARCQYDRIVVDTPPALGLAETTGMLPLVDGVVMVVWSGYTPTEQVKTAVTQLRNNGAKFFGFVLNQLDLKCPTNYFRYYYFSDYYYTSYKA